MSNYELFKIVYGNSSDVMPIGTRVSFQSLNAHLKNKALTEEALKRLFVECPTKFPGENKNEKHYLLKKRWAILNEFDGTVYCWKKFPEKKWMYVKLFIVDTLFACSTWRWYMHPTAVERHGRFFLTPSINF